MRHMPGPPVTSSMTPVILPKGAASMACMHTLRSFGFFLFWRTPCRTPQKWWCYLWLPFQPKHKLHPQERHQPPKHVGFSLDFPWFPSRPKQQGNPQKRPSRHSLSLSPFDGSSLTPRCGARGFAHANIPEVLQKPIEEAHGVVAEPRQTDNATARFSQ